MDLHPAQIATAVAVLIGGTVAFVVVLTIMARLVDRLIDVVVARVAQPVRPVIRRAGGRRARRPLAGLPRTALAAMLTGLLLFALAWSSFVLARVRFPT